MLEWVKQANADIWSAEGGDAHAVVARSDHGYELTAWWARKQGQLTNPKKPPAFATLEEAQAEAERLIFTRTADWARLMED